MPGKNKEYEVTVKGYEALGASTLSALIKQCEQVVKTNQKLGRTLLEAYKNVTSRKDRF